MKILAFDSALDGCSAALFDGERLLAHKIESRPRGQAEHLVPLLGSCLAAAGLRLDDLDALAVTIGPGTFTGLRIALSAARGMALVRRLPMIGVTTLEAYAAMAAVEDGPVVAAIDARRGEVYLQAFSNPGLAPMGPPGLFSLENALAILPPGRLSLIGSGAPLMIPGVIGRARLIGAPDTPIDARSVARLAMAKGISGAAPLRPLYLRAPDAKLPDGR